MIMGDTMKQAIGMAEAKSKLAELVGQVKYGGKIFVLERRGQPMAILMGVDEFDRLQRTSGQPDGVVSSPLSPHLLLRQERLVQRAQFLRQRLQSPTEQLAELLADLPPDADEFWLEIQETG